MDRTRAHPLHNHHFHHHSNIPPPFQHRSNTMPPPFQHRSNNIPPPFHHRSNTVPTQFTNNVDDAIKKINKLLFESVPSADEIEDALSALMFLDDPPHQETQRIIELLLPLCYPMMLIDKHRSSTISDAIHLLQTDTSVKEVATSLASDKHVWKAATNNETVKYSVIIVDNSGCVHTHITEERIVGLMKKFIEIMESKMVGIMKRYIGVFAEVNETNGQNLQVSFIESMKVKMVETMTWMGMFAVEIDIDEPTGQKLQASFIVSMVVFLLVIIRRVSDTLS